MDVGPVTCWSLVQRMPLVIISLLTYHLEFGVLCFGCAMFQSKLKVAVSKHVHFGKEKLETFIQ